MGTFGSRDLQQRDSWLIDTVLPKKASRGVSDTVYIPSGGIFSFFN